MFLDCSSFDLLSGDVHVEDVHVEHATLPVMVRQIDTSKLGLENILGYHPCHLEKFTHQKRVQFKAISYFPIISHPTVIINIFLKSKKTCLLRMIDLL